MTRRFSHAHELAEVGKLAVGTGVGGLLGWLATMASVKGTSTAFKVWTVWSVLLVAVSGAAIVVGCILWRVFRRPESEKPAIYAPGAIFNVYVQPSPTGQSTAPVPSPPAAQVRDDEPPATAPVR